MIGLQYGEKITTIY